MLTGEESDPDIGRAVEQYQITTIDHGFNASTFTARVISSTGADVGAAVVGGIGALSGPLHGGAPRRALGLLDAIGTRRERPPVPRRPGQPRRADHGLRPPRLQDRRPALGCSCAAWPSGSGAEKIEFAKAVEQTVVEVLAELKPGRNLYANVEFYAGVVMDHCGLPPRAVHADVRVEPRDRLVRQHPRAGGRQPDHPARRPATSARRRPQPGPRRATADRASRIASRSRDAERARRRAPAPRPAVVARRTRRRRSTPSRRCSPRMRSRSSSPARRRHDRRRGHARRSSRSPPRGGRGSKTSSSTRRKGEASAALHAPPWSSAPARRLQDRRPHRSPHPGGGEPHLPQARLRGTRHQRLPVRAPRLGGGARPRAASRERKGDLGGAWALSLRDSSVVVIGGSSGIGFATARRANDAGARVTIVWPRPVRLAKCAIELGDEVRSFALDVADEGAVEALFDSLDAVDHVVNLAGTHVAGTIAELDTASMRGPVDNRFWGAISRVQVRAPRWPGGRSLSARVPASPGLGPVRRSSPRRPEARRCSPGPWRHELSPIRVNVVRPGIVDTPLLDGSRVTAGTT